MKKNTSYIINSSRFFGDFTPIVPYMALFFLQKDITVSNISLLFFVWALSVLVFEIPTGILADKINKKTILIASRIIKLFCFCVWLISPTFIGFAIGFILWGLASALDSGAFQAFLYDHLHSYNAHDLFSKHYGTASSWSFIGLLFSAIIAAVLIHFHWSYNALLVISILSLSASTALFLLAPRPVVNSPQDEKESLFLNIQNNLRFVWTNNALLTIFIIGMTTGGLKGALEEYYPLLLETGGVALSLIGMSIAGFELMKSLGSFIAGRVRYTNTSQLLLFGTIGILMLGIGTTHGMILIVIIAILTLFDAVLWILNDTALQDISTHRNRATIASYKNFGVELVALTAFFTFNIATKTRPLSIIYILGGISIFVISIVLAISNRKKIIQQTN